MPKLRACLKMQSEPVASSLASRLQAVRASDRLQAGLQTRIFRKALRRPVEGLCVSLLLAGPLFSGAQAAQWDIEIEDFLFIPDRLVISVGDTVTWTAKASEHTVTSDTGVFDSQTIWDFMPFGEMFSYTFAEEGVFPYFCQGHGGPGGSAMSGVITVVSATAVNHRPATPANVSPADGATNLPVGLTLSASAFRDSDAGDFHWASQWIVRRASDAEVVVDTGEIKTNLTSFKPGGLANETAYAWQTRYKDGQGGWSDYSPATRFSTLKAVAQVGFGLLASYSNTPDHRAPFGVTTNATIDFHWGNMRPHRRITANGFGARWEGALLPAFTETYEFRLETRGGVRLWVKNELLIDEWDNCSFRRTWRGQAELVGGQPVSVRIDYAADPVDALLTLRWSSGSQPLEVVPARRLFPPGVLEGL